MLLGSGPFQEETENHISYRLVSLGVEGIASSWFLVVNNMKEKEPPASVPGCHWGDVLSLPALPPAGLQSWFVRRELAICCGGWGKRRMSECWRRNRDSAFRNWVPASCVSGASWSQEVKEHMLSGDCSFGLKLSLGIWKPLDFQHWLNSACIPLFHQASCLMRVTVRVIFVRARVCTHAHMHQLPCSIRVVSSSYRHKRFMSLNLYQFWQEVPLISVLK